MRAYYEKSRATEELYIAGESLDFTWTKAEKMMVIKMLNVKATIREIAKELRRNILEVMILTDDLIKDSVVDVGTEILRYD